MSQIWRPFLILPACPSEVVLSIASSFAQMHLSTSPSPLPTVPVVLRKLQRCKGLNRSQGFSTPLLPFASFTQNLLTPSPLRFCGASW